MKKSLMLSLILTALSLPAYAAVGTMNITDVGVTIPGCVATGVVGGDYAGDVKAIGDVNGDGIADLAISARNYVPGSSAGQNYIIYGKAGVPKNFNLYDVGTIVPGVKITGVTANKQTGLFLVAAGDMNGDGIDDFIIGDYGTSAYLIFGSKTLPKAISLNTVGTTTPGIVFKPKLNWSFSGFAAGDINRDGKSDLVAIQITQGGTEISVVYGEKSLVSNPNLVVDSTFLNGVRGFTLKTVFPSTKLSVATVNANRDCYTDILIGNSYFNSGFQNISEGYLIFGKSQPFPVVTLLDDTLLNGVTGVKFDSLFSLKPHAIGDINADGYEDFAFNGNQGALDSGQIAIIFGRSEWNTTPVIDIQGLNGTTGLVMFPWTFTWPPTSGMGNSVGDSMSYAGDYNRDGIGDFALTDTQYKNGLITNAGRTVVIFGRKVWTAGYNFINNPINGTQSVQFVGTISSFATSTSVDFIDNTDGKNGFGLLIGAIGGGFNIGKGYIINNKKP